MSGVEAVAWERRPIGGHGQWYPLSKEHYAKQNYDSHWARLFEYRALYSQATVDTLRAQLEAAEAEAAGETRMTTETKMTDAEYIEQIATFYEGKGIGEFDKHHRRLLDIAARLRGERASPENCRERLIAEGKPFPKSGCGHCKTGGLTGCPYERGVHQGPAPTAGKYDDVLKPFVAMMERELHANAGKGDRPGWLQMDHKTVLLEIYYHLSKLQKAMHDGNVEGVREFAADVANMAMMAVDVCGLLTKEDAA